MVRRNQLRPTLNITTSQRLAMTPSLLQKIELLTLNQLELSELMTQEMVENPFLEEVADGAEADGTETAAEAAEPEQAPEASAEESPETDGADSKEEEQLNDAEFEYFFGEYLGGSFRGQQSDYDPDRPTFELFLASSSSLQDHLEWQLNLADFSDELRPLAEFLIGNINDEGYLTLSLEEVVEATGCEPADAESALAVIQEMEPTGVGARDVRECLLIQLRASDDSHPLAERLVEDYLELLQKRKYKELRRRLYCSIEELSEAIESLRQFSPQPGEKFDSAEPVYIRPDVYLYKVDDEYQIMLNDDGLPRLRLNRVYRRMLLGGSDVSKDTKSYVRERFRSAVELLRSIDQRQQTIYRVCDAIIARQRRFLEKGKMFLKPMLIKDIAEELGVHPSTISRVVANKYAHTPQGVIELRKFFTVGVENSHGQTISTVRVKERIRQIIEDENERRPYSDQKLSEMLKEEGIEITRRTVAKYRDQMKIAGSRERRASLLI